MDLLKRSEEVLKKNWRDGYNVPSAKLYPFQWNWDAGFTALGYTHFDLDAAISEMEHLFKGQWKNGFIPHINFHKYTGQPYFPGPDVWRSELSPFAPTQLKTSGITQNPIHGFILKYLFERHKDEEVVQQFLKRILPKLIVYHNYLIKHRDPYQEGLLYINHPWEEMDNSPYWDLAFDKIEIDEPINYQRTDKLLVAAEERPSNYFYDRVIYLLNLYAGLKYDESQIFEKTPFAIQGLLFNSAFICSNESLIKLSEHFELDTQVIEDWNEKAIKAFQEKLWDEATGSFYPYDLKNRQLIKVKKSIALTTLVAGIPSSTQAEQMLEHLNGSTFSGSENDFYWCSVVANSEKTFDPKNYWRGPIWMPINLLIYRGLQRYGFREEAQRLREDSLELIRQVGFYEYFDPRKSIIATSSKGYGGKEFSWTAAVCLEFLNQNFLKEANGFSQTMLEEN